MMRESWRRSARLLVAGLGLAAGAVAPSGAAEFELKFGSTNSNSRSIEEVVAPLTSAVAAASNGRITFDVRPAGGFGPTAGLLQQLQSGEVDLALVIPGYFAGGFPRTAVMELPTLFKTAEDGSRTLWRLHEEGLLGGDYSKYKVLALFVTTPFALMVTDKQVSSLRDLRGMRVRVAGATTGLALARLGLVPLGLPTNVIGEAFDRGWLDAMSSGYDTARGVKGTGNKMIIDQVTTLIDAHFSTTAQVILMSPRSYQKLPRDLQALIDRHSGLELSLRSGRVKDAAETATKRELAASAKYRMLEVSAEDQAEMERRIAPAFEEWAAGLQMIGIDGATLLGRARALSGQPAS